MQQIGIGLAGFGNVGAGVFKHLSQNRLLLSERLGLEFAVRRIAVRDRPKAQRNGAPAALLTTELDELLTDPACQIIVELIGGIEPARTLILRAIEHRKVVVTGNKALLAEHGQEIFEAATRHKVPVFFEAAVAGGIPIIKSIREAFVGNHIASIHGIVNGTTNYILTRMTDSGLDYADALREAQQLGYAEADPTLDVNGWDAGHKAIILASLAYGYWVGCDQVSVEGITDVTAEDIRCAQTLGYVIKLLAVIKGGCNGGNIEVRVQPTLIPANHVLASVKFAYNAMLVQGDIVGQTLFYGRGAGQDPTSSAVISDIAEAADALLSPKRHYGFMPHGLYGSCEPIGETRSHYFLRVPVDDRPGVLAQVAGVLGRHEIGISSMMQPDAHGSETVNLVLMLHDAKLAQVQRAREEMTELPCVKALPRLLRVESFE
jgi:homoserine dehydrogenase